MVISPTDPKGHIIVILTDDERLPGNFNTANVLVFRKGESTNRELVVVKELGKLADPSILKQPEVPVCNYSGDGNPLHQHEDGSWWFYEESWVYENGPYLTYDAGWEALEKYCINFLAETASTTADSNDVTEADGIQTHSEGTSS